MKRARPRWPAQVRPFHFAVLASVLLAPGCGRGPLVYKDPARPVDERVKDLLARMTLEEKVAQTLGAWKRKDRITDETGRFDPAKARELLGNGIGQIEAGQHRPQIGHASVCLHYRPFQKRQPQRGIVHRGELGVRSCGFVVRIWSFAEG